MGIGFTAPLVLLGLLGLPLLWWVLRAVPPAPRRLRFGAIALLAGLHDREQQTSRTPWWLLALRLAALAAAIIGFAGPVLHPSAPDAPPARGNLLIVLDASWPAAPVWAARSALVDQLLAEAQASARPSAVIALSDAPRDDALAFAAAGQWRERLANLAPRPWAPQAAWADWIAAQDARFETYWLTDGVDFASRADLLAALEQAGPVRVFAAPAPIYALRGLGLAADAVTVDVLRADAPSAARVQVQAIGLDPAGNQRVLASADVDLAQGATSATATLALPAQLRSRISRLALAGQPSAGAVQLADDLLRRPRVALVNDRAAGEAAQILQPLHYLAQALAPTSDLLRGDLADLLPANPDVIVLADVATLPEAISADLQEWVARGGVLLRFAGPRLAASETGRRSADPLLPVRLRTGGRDAGGAMSWGSAKPLASFDAQSPFFGLDIPADVAVSRQVLAQPDPDLAQRVIAQLDDGTALVTRAFSGQGQIVLFHVTANAEWSNLPLSGLFVQMLQRLAVAGRSQAPTGEELAASTWAPLQRLDGFGQLRDASADAGIAGPVMAAGQIGPDLPPGLYGAAGQQVAVNTLAPDAALRAADWPARITVQSADQPPPRALQGVLLALALALLALDVLGTARLRGGAGRIVAGLLALALALIWPAPAPLAAQEVDSRALRATADVVLAYVQTGDAAVDQASQAGLAGLSRALTQRTSVEPGAPMAVDLDRDELAFFAFLYWPITPDQPLPSRAAYAKLNAYLATGGMILFDTADADRARFGAASAAGQRLQAIARALDIPPLEPVPQGHVLTRAFYLISAFPGRIDSADVWVEAAAGPSGRNDGVTPVVIGGNDWARAWAVGESGAPLFPVGRGMAGERQREFALRFGINLIMHVLSGNYKADQVHVPALLERLGQ